MREILEFLLRVPFAIVKSLKITKSPKILIKTLVEIWRTQGFRGLYRSFLAVAHRSSERAPGSLYDEYPSWVRDFSAFDEIHERQAHAWLSENLQHLPLITVVMPVHKPNPAHLEEAISSVLSQIYPNWQLSICDDASNDPVISAIIQKYLDRDARITVVRNKVNLHISKSSNLAANAANGDYLAFLDHDDVLAWNALLEVAKCVIHYDDAAFIYSDEDKLGPSGERKFPHFKPKSATELSLSYNVYCHLMVVKTSFFRELGGFDSRFDGAQDWDFALRAVRALSNSGKNSVVHIPKILYHWRETPLSTSTSGANKEYARSAGISAVENFLKTSEIKAVVKENPLLSGTNHVIYELPGVLPSVDIIIPTRDGIEILKPCINSILSKTIYPNYKIVVVDNGSKESATLHFLASLPKERVRVIRDDSEFNYSQLNNLAVLESSADFVCLVNNDIEVIDPGWLTELVSVGVQPDVGAVGPMLLYPDNTIQHAGVVLGLGGAMGVAGHWQKKLPVGTPGYMGRLCLRQNYSAVTAACLLVRRSIYKQVGGFDTALKVAFNDVDFCLKIQSIGYLNVWTPYAQLFHHESKSRGADDTPAKISRAAQEVILMRDRWGSILENDPCFNSNLTLEWEDLGLARPPRNLNV